MRRLVLGYSRPIVARMRRWQVSALGPWYAGPWGGRFVGVPAITSENVLVAYQANWGGGTFYEREDAASKANSLSNLADPGTGDAVETETIAWTEGGGWDFDGTGYLTSVVPDEDCFMFAQFRSDDVFAEYMCGCGSGGAANRFYLVADNNDGAGFGWGDDSYFIPEPWLQGSLGVGGAAGYVNGEPVATSIGTMATPTEAVLIGTLPLLVPGGTYWFTGEMDAFVIVKSITDAQAMAISAAMGIIGSGV